MSRATASMCEYVRQKPSSCLLQGVNRQPDLVLWRSYVNIALADQFPLTWLHTCGSATPLFCLTSDVCCVLLTPLLCLHSHVFLTSATFTLVCLLTSDDPPTSSLLSLKVLTLHLALRFHRFSLSFRLGYRVLPPPQPHHHSFLSIRYTFHNCTFP